MQEALDLAAGHARAVGATRIHRIRLRVGERSGVVPEALRFAFEALSVGGVADGAVLEMEWVPVPPPAPDRQGTAVGEPDCIGHGGRVRDGCELELTALEVS